MSCWCRNIFRVSYIFFNFLRGYDGKWNHAVFVCPSYFAPKSKRQTNFFKGWINTRESNVLRGSVYYRHFYCYSLRNFDLFRNWPLQITHPFPVRTYMSSCAVCIWKKNNIHIQEQLDIFQWRNWIRAAMRSLFKEALTTWTKSLPARV